MSFIQSGYHKKTLYLFLLIIFLNIILPWVALFLGSFFAMYTIVLYILFGIFLHHLIKGMKNNTGINNISSNINSSNKGHATMIKIISFLILVVHIVLYCFVGFTIAALTGMGFGAPNAEFGLNLTTILFILINGGIAAGFLMSFIAHLKIFISLFKSPIATPVMPTDLHEIDIKLKNTLSSIDISKISHIHFMSNSDESFDINLDSIKQIAVYISQKSGKMIFAPGELTSEKEFLLKYYQPSLLPDQYNTLTKILSEWTDIGGRFDIIPIKK